MGGGLDALLGEALPPPFIEVDLALIAAYLEVEVGVGWGEVGLGRSDLRSSAVGWSGIGGEAFVWFVWFGSLVDARWTHFSNTASEVLSWSSSSTAPGEGVKQATPMACTQFIFSLSDALEGIKGGRGQ